ICVRVHITYYVVISHHHSRYPRVDMRRTVHRMYSLFFFKQKTAYEMIWWLEFRRVLFRSLSTVTVESGWAPNLTGKGEPERLIGAKVSGLFFKTYGIAPLLGRALLPDEDQEGRNHVIRSEERRVGKEVKSRRTMHPKT